MYYFTPDQVGNYTFSFYYPGQVYTWTNTTSGATTADTGDIFTAATSRTITVTVGQTPAISPAYPVLPTEFWTYPIFGTNYNWYTIASNWLSGPYTPAFGSHSGSYQPYGSAPSTPHVMWTNPIQFGGVVGGNETAIPGEGYYQGGSYNTRFTNPIIMQGILFFQLPFGESGTGGNYVAWDLKTGQQLWSINASATGVSLVPSFGYLPTMDQPNQHGILPDGLLIATTTVTGQGTVWRTYDPMTGVLTPMTITNVPGGTAVAGPTGEYLKILLTNYGNTTNPNYYLSEWNSTRVFGYYSGTGTAGWYTGTENASLAGAYDWNQSITLSQRPTDSAWTIAGNCISQGNIMLLSQGTFDSMSAYFSAKPGPVNITAISLQPQNLGKALWTQTYPVVQNNSGVLAAWDPNTAGVFNIWYQDPMTQYGYSLSNGALLWGPSTVPNASNTDFNYIGDASTQEQAQYGNLYWAGYTGQCYCFNETTGALEWTFGNGDTPDNSTLAGTGTPYGYDTVFISCIADGMVYLSSTEHSPNSPLYPTYGERCINATTGLQIWYMPCYGNLMYSAMTPIASGYMVADNTFTQEIYCFGQGPSATTVTAPNPVTSVGTPMVIRGTVIDTSAGTQQTQQKADFPNGVPCVSDASQSDWMQYAYEQQPMPNNAIGVPVTLSVIDANGNQRPIGTTTSDSSGMFTYTWTPDITGNYTVIANFAGSNAYYPSSAETSFYATAPPATVTPQPTQAPSMSDLYFVPAIAGLFVLVIVVAIVLALLMLRKRP
jgi:hypothetical protein